jgi:hypothetical protein
LILEFSFDMSQWKLVEAEAVGEEKNSNSQQNKQFNNNNKTRDNNRGNNGNRRHDNNRGNNTGNNVRRNNSNGKDSRNRNGNRGGNRRQPDIYIPDTPETRQQYAAMAVQLLEHYFSDDSLSCDTFVRSYFDTAGFIPIAFVCNFPDIVSIGAYYEDIVSQLNASEKFEIDAENDTMRVSGWEKWLMPNQEGGFGLPRYIKNAAPVATEQCQQQQEVSQAEVPSAPVDTRDRSGSKELSVTASEYVFNVPTASATE